MAFDPMGKHHSRLDELQAEFDEYPGAAPGGTGPTGLASGDAKGYSDLLNRRVEYLNLKNAQQGKAPVTQRYGGEIPLESPSMPTRPSLSALSGYDPNDFAARNRAGNGPEGPTFEQRRQGKILADSDQRAEAGLMADQVRNSANFDIGSGQAAARATGLGDIQRSEALQNARSAATIDEDPMVKAMRDRAFADEMEKLRRRYSDPALIKGDAERAVALERAKGGVERQGLINQGNVDVQGARNTGAEGVANIGANARVAAAGASVGQPAGGYTTRDFNPNAPPPGAGKTMSPQEFAAWQAQSGLNMQDAMRVAQTQGYTITR